MDRIEPNGAKGSWTAVEREGAEATCVDGGRLPVEAGGAACSHRGVGARGGASERGVKVRDDQAVRDPRRDEEALAAESGRILVVDDSESNRVLVRGYLGTSGYTVETASGGREAIAAFAARGADLVLLDVEMPDLDGFETCRALRAFPEGDVTQIVFLTGLSDRATLARALEGGVDDFLTKPIQRAELLVRVRSLLALSRLRREQKRNLETIRAQRDEVLRIQEQKDELVELVVHDLKSPLASILASGAYLAERPGLDDDGVEAATDIVRSAESMHRMVMDLLDVGRSEEGALPMHTAPLDVGAFLREVGAAVAVRAKTRGQAIEVVTDAPGMIEADRDLLWRVMENLVDNCLKYAPSGEKVTLSARARDHLCEIRVSDRGPGVPEAYREKIFEKYARLDADANRHARSSRGLGLLFCRLAVEAHGGRIRVEQNAPHGASFCIELPLGA